jgi:hypothetical protein
LISLAAATRWFVVGADLDAASREPTSFQTKNALMAAITKATLRMISSLRFIQNPVYTRCAAVSQSAEPLAFS